MSFFLLWREIESESFGSLSYWLCRVVGVGLESCRLLTVMGSDLRVDGFERLTIGFISFRKELTPKERQGKENQILKANLR